MTGPELRNLLVAVEEAGGPNLRRWGDKSSLWAADLDYEDGEAISVGVLTRDLIERGLEVVTRSFGGSEGFDPYYTARIRRGAVIIADAEGATTLHALLEAWTDAAQLERWGT